MIHDMVAIYWKNGNNSIHDKVQVTFDADDVLKPTSAKGGWLYVNIDEALAIVAQPAPAASDAFLPSSNVKVTLTQKNGEVEAYNDIDYIVDNRKESPFPPGPHHGLVVNFDEVSHFQLQRLKSSAS
jgi:hypothetical protein